MKNILKKIVTKFNSVSENPTLNYLEDGKISLNLALKEQNLEDIFQTLSSIISDLTNQETDNDYSHPFYQLKVRSHHAFQVKFFLNLLRKFDKKEIIVMDIGDSAGTHMTYFKTIARGLGFHLKTFSVNLDAAAVEKIRMKGLDAYQCRAEDIKNVAGVEPDIIVSFQMVEHLHDPCSFLRSIAKYMKTEHIFITVPFLETSRVGLHSIRKNISGAITAEQEHIFELNPEDWKLLFLHSGWKVLQEEIYYQYPLAQKNKYKKMWLEYDYEGFWGVHLYRDLEISDRYTAWGELQ